MSCALTFQEGKSSLNIWGMLSAEHGFSSSVSFGIQAATCWNKESFGKAETVSLPEPSEVNMPATDELGSLCKRTRNGIC